MSATLRVLEHNAVVYRRTWRGSVLVSFISPILFLAAMGVGLGNLIPRVPSAGQVSYLAFLAPGLLAANAMQTGAMESMYPVMGKIKWMKTYEAMLATPVRVWDLVAGEVLWLGIRLGMVATSFFIVMVLFHAVGSPLGVLAVPAALLTGIAFAAPILAFSATQHNDSGFNAVQRFIIIPLFLLGGTFFPIAKLPAVFQAIAWATPLAHGVALTRGLTLGGLTASAASAHLAVLAIYGGAGIVAASITLRRRLVT